MAAISNHGTSQPRATQDLIAELEGFAATGRYPLVALIVQFPGNTEFLTASQLDFEAKVEKLDSAIETGGRPIGYVAFSQEWKKGQISGWLLSEHEEDAGLQEYLAGLIGVLSAGTLVAHGVRSPIPTEALESAWTEHVHEGLVADRPGTQSEQVPPAEGSEVVSLL